MKKVSIVVPCFNEEENVVAMAGAIKQQMQDLDDYSYDIIFIDNDSKDNTRALIRQLCAEDNHVKAIFNSKNYGQFSSPYYGVLQATGDCAILLSCDFQEPVDLIPVFLKEWEAGYKLVMGQKTSSKESGLIYAARGFYYRFMAKHSDVEFLPQVTGFGLYDRSFIEVMRAIQDPRPFLRGLISEVGYGVKLIPYEQSKRRGGKSSNNFFTYIDAIAQSLTTYTKFGCRLALGCGFVATIASIVTMVAFFIYKLINWNTFPVEDYIASLVIILLCSMNLFFIGVVGEYVMDVNIRARRKPLVIEAERINFQDQP